MWKTLSVLWDTSDFPARWHCGNWTAVHGWTHIVSELAIAGAYMAIPILLAIAAVRRRDIGAPRVVWLFVVFIIACGSTHLVEAVIFWHPIYRIGAVAKVITALASWATVVVLLYYGPRVLRLPSITEINLRLQREVEQRRRAEQRLEEQAQVLQIALEAGRIGTWRWDLRNNRDQRDAGLNEILGLERKASTQPVEDFLKRVHPEDREDLQSAIDRAMEGGEDYAAEARVIRPDNTIRWISGRGKTVRDEQGVPTLMTGAVVDITDAHRAEEGRARLAAIVESTPDAIISQSLDGEILTWNSGAAKTFGYTAEEAVGQPVSIIVPEDRLGELEEYQAAAARGETIGHWETVRRCKDGGLIDVWLAVSPIRDRHGRVRAISMVDRDITESKRQSERLQRLNNRLKAKNAEMEQFVYFVSHDLKSPLVTIIGFVGLLREDLSEGETREEVLDGLNRIEGAAERMTRLIDDLLELSRVGRVKHESTMVDVGALVEDLLVDLTGRLEQSSAELVIENDLDAVYGDPHRVRQVIQNLLSNAIKYGCPERGAQIRIGSERTADETVIRVGDDGPGVRPEDRQKIFRLFEQAGSRREGTGVGLALVRKIMDAHGGRVWLESEGGNGAMFCVAFPSPAPEQGDRDTEVPRADGEDNAGTPD